MKAPLKLDGMLLVTIPGISQISRYDMDRWSGAIDGSQTHQRGSSSAMYQRRERDNHTLW